jgi:uncharacterized protein (TIGR03437 family)
MTTRLLVFLVLVSAASAMAASSGFLLGADYSEWLAPYVTQIATDSSGALYILSQCAPTATSSSCVTKLSADGTTILWQNNVGFRVNDAGPYAQQMAVDPNGGVYAIPERQDGDTSYSVAKLNGSGTGIAWKTPVSVLPECLAADSQGRVYVAGLLDFATWTGAVVRLNAAGSAVDYTAQLAGVPSAIAVDGTGAAFAAGLTAKSASGFLARLAPDGSAGFYSTSLVGNSVLAIGLDANGNSVVYAANGDLRRFDSTGFVTLSESVMPASAFGLDAAGNAYLAGDSTSLSSVRNSLATCGSALLTVFAPSGSVLQTTYIPGAVSWSEPNIAIGPNSTVFVSGVSDGTFVPTQAGPFPAGEAGTSFLWHLSPNANAQTVPLVCAGNAASFGEGPIAPGELVTLMGSRLGPEQGIQTQATLDSPYPTQAAGVEVTFDGMPAPLLWVQDSQINAVAPWSLTPGQNTRICVSYDSVNTNCLTWPVAQTSPAVFTVDGIYAAALNQDGTINSVANPAAPGSIVTIWVNGLGPITPPQADGTLVGLPLPGNVLPPVAVDSPAPPFEPCQPGMWPPWPCQTYTQFEVTYAGPAPYMVAGVSQINFQLVAGTSTGQIVVVLPYQQISPSFGIYASNQ